MAISKEVQVVAVVAALTVLVGSVGLYLGFHSNQYVVHGKPTPQAPDQGPILYEMRSVRSNPNRIRFEWREIPKAATYRVTVMSAANDSLFTSPELRDPYWTIPPKLRPRLKKQTGYHWRVSVRLESGAVQASEAAAFATQ